MKKQLSPEQKFYRDNRDRKIIGIIAPMALFVLGIWMVLDPTKKKHASVERATVSIVKDIWGIEAGIGLLLLGGAWAIYAIIQLRKFQKANGHKKI